MPESTMLALLGHMSRQMLERYSHIRMMAKRDAMEGIMLAEPVVSAEDQNRSELQPAVKFVQ